MGSDRKSWRFGLRSLLITVLVVSGALSLWRYQANSQVRALGDAIADDSFDSRRLIHHRGFRSSGLYERLNSATDGFGTIQIRLVDSVAMEVGGQPAECLILEDISSRTGGNNCYLVVAMQRQGVALSWIEISAAADRQLTVPKFVASGSATHCKSVAWSTSSPVVKWESSYRLDPAGIVLTSTEVSHDNGGERSGVPPLAGNRQQSFGRQ